MLDNKETNNKKHQNLTNTMKKVLSKFTQIMKRTATKKSGLCSAPLSTLIDFCVLHNTPGRDHFRKGCWREIICLGEREKEHLKIKET